MSIYLSVYRVSIYLSWVRLPIKLAVWQWQPKVVQTRVH